MQGQFGGDRTGRGQGPGAARWRRRSRGAVAGPGNNVFERPIGNLFFAPALPFDTAFRFPRRAAALCAQGPAPYYFSNSSVVPASFCPLDEWKRGTRAAGHTTGWPPWSNLWHRAAGASAVVEDHDHATTSQKSTSPVRCSCKRSLPVNGFGTVFVLRLAAAIVRNVRATVRDQGAVRQWGGLMPYRKSRGMPGSEVPDFGDLQIMERANRATLSRYIFWGPPLPTAHPL